MTNSGKAISRIEQRELYLLSVPYSDGGLPKVRPGIVISNSRYNSSQDDVLMCPLTSNIKEVPYSLNITNRNLESGHLKAVSRIRCDKIFSIRKISLLRRIGKIDGCTFERVKTEIFAVLAD
jgi:mRNA interferase MazF